MSSYIRSLIKKDLRKHLIKNKTINNTLIVNS